MAKHVSDLKVGIKMENSLLGPRRVIKGRGKELGLLGCVQDPLWTYGVNSN